MNYVLMMNKQMATKHNSIHNITVLTVAMLISVVVVWTAQQKHPSSNLAYRVYYGVKGWGYDILVNKKIVIHQDIVPAIATQKAFDERGQAEKAAKLIIQKIKSGESPSLSVPEIQSILTQQMNEGE